MSSSTYPNSWGCFFACRERGRRCRWLGKYSRSSPRRFLQSPDQSPKWKNLEGEHERPDADALGGILRTLLPHQIRLKMTYQTTLPLLLFILSSSRSWSSTWQSTSTARTSGTRLQQEGTSCSSLRLLVWGCCWAIAVLFAVHLQAMRNYFGDRLRDTAR